MNITSEPTANREVVLTVEVEPERLQRAMQQAAQHVSRIRPLPGFRPGKAPYALVERTFGKDLLLEEALEEMSRAILVDALKEQNLDPLDVSKVEIPQKEPPIFKFTVALRPEVKLGDYKNIKMRPPEVTVTDDEVSALLSRFQSSQATITPVEREVRKGDVVTVDITGGVPEHDPVDQKNAQFAIGDPNQPGLPFEDQLLGMHSGETRDITHTYPEDDADEAFRGKTATYTVTVHEIKERQLPELDDEFAKNISQFQTLDQFKGSIREVIRRQKERDQENEFVDQVVDAIADQSEIAYPPRMVEDEITHQIEHQGEEVKRLGLTWAKYLELAGKTEAQAREESRPQAEKQLRRTLVLLELVKAENLPVTKEEVDREIERRARSAGAAGGTAAQTRRLYASRQARNDLELDMKWRKTVDRVVAMVKGEPVSGLILTPAMMREVEQAKQAAEAQKAQEARGVSPSGLVTDPSQARGASPSGLITDPSQVRAADWPSPFKPEP